MKIWYCEAPDYVTSNLVAASNLIVQVWKDTQGQSKLTSSTAVATSVLVPFFKDKYFSRACLRK